MFVSSGRRCAARLPRHAPRTARLRADESGRQPPPIPRPTVGVVRDGNQLHVRGQTGQHWKHPEAAREAARHHRRGWTSRQLRGDRQRSHCANHHARGGRLRRQVRRQLQRDCRRAGGLPRPASSAGRRPGSSPRPSRRRQPRAPPARRMLVAAMSNRGTVPTDTQILAATQSVAAYWLDESDGAIASFASSSTVKRYATTHTAAANACGLDPSHPDFTALIDEARGQYPSAGVNDTVVVIVPEDCSDLGYVGYSTGGVTFNAGWRLHAERRRPRGGPRARPRPCQQVHLSRRLLRRGVRGLHERDGGQPRRWGQHAHRAQLGLPVRPRVDPTRRGDRAHAAALAVLAHRRT